MIFEKYIFFKLMNNAVFGMLNLSQQKEETIGVRTKLSLCKVFHRISIGNRNEKTQILLNKLVYSGLSILELSKIKMHVFWYDYVKPKYGEKGHLCYMDTDSFAEYIESNHGGKNYIFR